MTQPDPSLSGSSASGPEVAGPEVTGPEVTGPEVTGPDAAGPEVAVPSLGEIERIVAGQHHNPHSVLGAHPGPDGVIIRALRPLATSVTAVLDDGRRLPMEHVHQGVFAVTVPDEKVPGYRIAAAYGSGSGEDVRDDPYRYL